ncbi:MAG: pyruvate kinase [Holosporales bacterium]|jgi:pyruvate kinase|nr:pyruvate kinase [Holosporales bacterium]
MSGRSETVVTTLVIHINRKTKIVATLGPASSSGDIIRELIESGVDMFRLNMSHGTHDVHEKNAHTVREIQKGLGANVSIVVDLQGPKIRIGTFADKSVTLLPGAKFRLDLDASPGNVTRVYLPHPEIIGSLEQGSEILLDDGKLKLKVVDNDGNSVETIVMDGGSLSNRKGVSVPGVILPISAITDKDQIDAGILNEIDADWLAVSFVQTADDIVLARNIVGPNIGILAKIEKPSAVSNIDSIVKAADAIIVARGDLGVEMPFESIPRVQKMLVDTARTHNKPCIVATQMLESMVSCHRPTRAEVSDVAHAVLEGADAVMLSAETASGKYPAEAVRTMAKVVTQTECDQAGFRSTRDTSGIDPVANAVSMITEMNSIRAIVVFTESGRSANVIAAARPNTNIIALTTSQRTARKLCMSWGITSIVIDEIFWFSQMLQIVQKTLTQNLDIKDGEKVIIVAGLPFRERGHMNFIHIYEVDKALADRDNGS